ncbi:hypothetical protein SCHPADRAFT_730496 [Schizopora paradoxa]|uniref:Uncharacterized protein n=1 Tax=Schizopora paradoxa TaxID=27342 RepID=A0A0H2R0M0_9AGAM|nr:hypothetical protein SCHPADRAFT_730496 [Schizopora paradoxa]
MGGWNAGWRCGCRMDGTLDHGTSSIECTRYIGGVTSFSIRSSSRLQADSKEHLACATDSIHPSLSCVEGEKWTGGVESTMESRDSGERRRMKLTSSNLHLLKSFLLLSSRTSPNSPARPQAWTILSSHHPPNPSYYDIPIPPTAHPSILVHVITPLTSHLPPHLPPQH